VLTTYEIFDRAERLEQLAADIYGALAARFWNDRDAHALFTRLRTEELQHASRVRLLAARYRHDPRLLERASGDRAVLDRLGAEGEAVLAAIREGTFGRDLDEVKRNLATLEGRFQDSHAELIAATGHPELRAFFEQLAEQDGEHRRLLAPAP
jgi:rubrerythrin